MPGLSQLKKFNADILSLGKEPELRAARGEKPVVFAIPKDIEDKDDSDDFIAGMPEPVDYDSKPEKHDTVDEDFSDIMGTVSSTASSSQSQNTEASSPGISVPDLSSLADLSAFSDNSDIEASAPDLSMFAEEESEPEPEPEPEEPEISDLSLEDLLSGAGFDGSEGASEDEPEPDNESQGDSELSNIEQEAPVSETFDTKPKETEQPKDIDFSKDDYSFGDGSDSIKEGSFDDIEDLSLDEVNFDSSVQEQAGAEPTEEAISSSVEDIEGNPSGEVSEKEETIPQDDFSADLLSLESEDELPSIEELSLEQNDSSVKQEPDTQSTPSFEQEDFGVPLEEVSIEQEVPKEEKIDLSFDDITIEDVTGTMDVAPKTSKTPEKKKIEDIDNFVPANKFYEFDDSFDDLDKIDLGTGFEYKDEDLDKPQDSPEDTSTSDPEEKIELDGFDIVDETPTSPISTPQEETSPIADDFSLDNVEDFTSDNTADLATPDNLFDAADLDLPTMDSDIGDVGISETDDFSLPETDNFELPEEGDIGSSANLDGDNFSIPESDSFDLPKSDSFDLPESDGFDLPESDSFDLPEDTGLDLPETGSFEMPDSEDINLPETDNFEIPDADNSEDSKLSDNLFDAGDFDLPEGGSAEESVLNITDDDVLGNNDSNSESTGLGDDFPSDFNFDLDDDASSSEQTVDLDTPIETFDTSEMDGLDFGIPDTDSQLNGESGFELGSSDDFGMDNGDFEIPGFSDVQTVEVNKSGKIKVPTKDEEQEEDETAGLPPNTLSDEQYEKFLKNLAYYPLNVRVAVEELIVKNEFTDDAEFEIVKKVLKKVSARQLAGELEKMLDISIPVPRDYERRTAEEYEAYKQSFQYQLKNKIIPGAILGVAAIIVCFFMFEFTKNFIYRPLKASSLYKQGYALLESEDFPQSETKFNEATTYNLQKKWFFKYARGYREHKQYIRAEDMYKKLLLCFKHDKSAGLEFASMEINELANYEKAEEILLRDVLDYHVNDQDAILLLGDNYLEWAVEKDPGKFEDARRRYSDLIQLYGSTDLNMSRMLRYFVRTDNLLEVLELKERFYPRPKSLGSDDLIEMSGYLLEKLYGPLSPSDEYLRSKIEDTKSMLVRAVKAAPTNPLALYNISRYYVETNNSINAKSTLNQTINAFDKARTIKKRDMYKYIDSYRMLGEEYTKDSDFLKARESYTNGISLFNAQNVGSGLQGTSKIGQLYSDYGDIEYFVSGNLDSALESYQDAVDNFYDKGEIRYKIGYIQYSKNDYSNAIGSFMKAGEEYADDPNLLLAMGNTLSLRNDNYAAQGYYDRLMEQLNAQKEQKGILFPQVRKDEYEIMDNFLKTTNNLGVTMYRLARRTGSSAYNAKAMVNLQESMRAWDSMTRNQESMVRLPGSNLAEQNLKYMTHPIPEFEPAIYTDISRTLSVEDGLVK